MANTVSLLSYANTFGDWMVTTNKLVGENNTLAANNYTKNLGTLYLSDPVLGLQVANNSIFGGQLQVQGVGSSAYVQNNLRVDGQVYFTNSILGLTNYGQANIGGPLLALSSNVSLSVSNNSTFGGYVKISGNTNISNTLTVSNTATFSSNIVVGTTATVSGNVIAQNYINVTKDVSAVNYVALNSFNGYGLAITGSGSLTNNLSVGGQLSVGGNFVINGSTVYNTNTFIINAGSSVGLTSSFGVNRGSSGANATIRWNESSQYFDINDVNNGNYYRILTDEYKNDSTYNGASSNVASYLAVNYLQSVANATNTSISTNVTNLQNQISANLATAKAYTDTANTYLQANTGSALTVAKAYTDTANAFLQNSSNQTSGTLPAARLPASGVSSGYWGGATQIPVLNIDATGRVISAANAAVSSTLSTAGSSGTGSVSLINQSLTVTSSNTQSFATVTASGTNLTINPVTSGVTAGSYGSSTAIPVITADQWGRITNLTTTAISTSITLAAGSGSGSVAGGGTLTLTGGTGITTSVTGSTYTITNAGVTSLTGTTNQIAVSASTGGVTLSTPQAIGTASSVQFGSFGVGTAASGTSGEIRATNNITAYYSDDRLKTRLGLIENALAKVLTLNGFYYEANQTAQDLGYAVKKEVGLSAQEVQSVLPEIVVPAPIDEKYLTIHYERVVPLLVEAIKELSQEIQDIKNILATK